MSIGAFRHPTGCSSRSAPGRISALAMTAAAALPSFQPLVNSCRVDPASGRHRDRAPDCAAIGRLLAAHGDTLVATRLGPALLRVSQTYVDADLAAARGGDWIYDRFTLLLPTEEDDAAAGERLTAFVADWIESRSEFEAMRHMALRAGLAPAPPDDWVDRLSPFAEERLRGDRQAATTNAGGG
jgi:hypothetical protein